MFAAGCLAALLAGGCAYSMSSLATSSGPKRHGGQWSVAGEQWVHVGELFDVSFALYSGTADYAVLRIEPLGRNKVVTTADRGRFVFHDLCFDEPTPPRKPLVLRAAAYLERGQRDFMDYDGQLLGRESPFDTTDQKIAGTTLKLHVYQSRLAIAIPADAGGYNWQTAKLLLYADPEHPSEIRLGREYRRGFRIEGPSAAGSFVVAYEPTADQIKHTDQTRAVFTVLNAAGNEHRQEVWLATP